MRRRVIWAIFRKEVLDTIRDRRTLVMMLGVPIVLYPALTLLMLQVAMVQKSSIDEKATRVALAKETPGLIQEWIATEKRIEFSTPEDPAAALRDGDLDVVVVAGADFGAALEARKRPTIELQYDATEMRSREGADRVEAVLNTKFKELHEAWLKAAGLSEAQISPFEVKDANVASAKKRSGTLLGITLPALLIVMLALGAFYPAVDLTAGEKERGTFETLLSTPCSKLEIVSGKFLTVFGLSLLTALLNFGSMAATIGLVISQVRGGAEGAALPQIHVEPLALLAVILVLLPLAFLISALMMSVAVFARSFKEAQNYMTPFLMIIVLPATVAALPGIKLSGFAALVPIVNVVLLFKDLMTGTASVEAVFTVLLSTSIFAGMSLLFAAWLFQREDVVLGGGSGGLHVRRSDVAPANVPTSGLALGTFCAVLVLIMYLGTLSQQWNLLGGLLITEYLLIAAPCLWVLWFWRIDFREALSLRRPGVGQLAGAVMMGAAALVGVMELGAWHNKVLPVPPELQEAFAGLFADGDTPLGLLKLLLIVAVTPALCEEILFRGVLYSGLKGRMHPVAVLILVGLLFGVFHLSIHRFASTAFLGVVLTYFVWRTGSIWPGVLVHALVNGTSILLATEHVPDAVVVGLRLRTVETEGVWWPVLIVAMVLALAGAALLGKGENRKTERSQEH